MDPADQPSRGEPVGAAPPTDDDQADMVAALQAMPADEQMATYLHEKAKETIEAPHLQGVNLSELTTLRLGGPCVDVVVADTQELLVAETLAADAAAVPLLVLSGGSNVVIADQGWPGRALLVRSRGIERDADQVTVAAGEPWDEFVDTMVAEGRFGVEALSGIPGSVGSTPIQNVGAYGQEVSESISEVLVWDRYERVECWLSAADCGFGYRTSAFKRNPTRWLVLAVRFRLPTAATGSPVRYAELARTLGVDVGQSAPLADVRRAVLGLRAAKGMVLDGADHDTWSAGSFFTNPVIAETQAAELPESAPRYPAADGLVKVSAAWLIEQSGIDKGFRLHPDSGAAVSTKHTLALTNRGGATTAELLGLAGYIRGQVQEKFGVTLQPEPVLVGCQLP